MLLGDCDYEGVRRIVYGDKGGGEAGDGAAFIPVCEKCGRFVRADPQLTFDFNGQPVGDTATCKRCGRTTMLFEGYPDIEPMEER